MFNTVIKVVDNQINLVGNTDFKPNLFGQFIF